MPLSFPSLPGIGMALTRPQEPSSRLPPISQDQWDYLRVVRGMNDDEIRMRYTLPQEITQDQWQYLKDAKGLDDAYLQQHYTTPYGVGIIGAEPAGTEWPGPSTPTPDMSTVALPSPVMPLSRLGVTPPAPTMRPDASSWAEPQLPPQAAPPPPQPRMTAAPTPALPELAPMPAVSTAVAPAAIGAGETMAAREPAKIAAQKWMQMSPGERFQHIANTSAQTLGNMTANTMVGVAALAKDLDAFWYQGAALGEGNVEDLMVSEWGQSVKRWTEQTFPSDPDLQASMVTMLVQGAVSTMPFWLGAGAASAVGMSPYIAPAVMGGLVESGAGYMESEGAPEAVRRATARRQIIPGMLEAVPVAHGFQRAGRGLGMGAVAVGEAIEEAVQEGSQQLMENLIARGVTMPGGVGYDPERSIFEGVPQGMMIGALVGGIFGAGGATVGPAKRAISQRGMGPEERAADDFVNELRSLGQQYAGEFGTDWYQERVEQMRAEGIENPQEEALWEWDSRIQQAIEEKMTPDEAQRLQDLAERVARRAGVGEEVLEPLVQPLDRGTRTVELTRPEEGPAYRDLERRGQQQQTEVAPGPVAPAPRAEPKPALGKPSTTDAFSDIMTALQTRAQETFKPEDVPAGDERDNLFVRLKGGEFDQVVEGLARQYNLEPEPLIEAIQRTDLPSYDLTPDELVEEITVQMRRGQLTVEPGAEPSGYEELDDIDLTRELDLARIGEKPEQEALTTEFNRRFAEFGITQPKRQAGEIPDLALRTAREQYEAGTWEPILHPKDVYGEVINAPTRRGDVAVMDEGELTATYVSQARNSDKLWVHVEGTNKTFPLERWMERLQEPEAAPEVTAVEAPAVEERTRSIAAERAQQDRVNAILNVARDEMRPLFQEERFTGDRPQMKREAALEGVITGGTGADPDTDWNTWLDKKLRRYKRPETIEKYRTLYEQELRPLFDEGVEAGARALAATPIPEPVAPAAPAGAEPFPKAGTIVDGRTVGENIPNQTSIAASFTDYTILPGVREVPLSAFESLAPRDMFYAADDIRRAEALAEEIRESGRVDPLIVAIDEKGPYILEGGHRAAALHILEAKSLPALVVFDETEAAPEVAPREQLRTLQQQADAAFERGERPAPEVLQQIRTLTDRLELESGRTQPELRQQIVPPDPESQRLALPAMQSPTEPPMYEAGYVGPMPLAHMKYEPAKYQWKEKETPPPEVWEDEMAGVVTVGRTPEGEYPILNGHARYTWGVQKGIDRLPIVRVVDIADVAEGRAIGALINMAEGHGTPVDVAKFLRDGGWEPGELAARGVSLTEKVVQDGIALSGLQQSLFGMVARGDMPVQRGAIIGAAGLSDEQQLDLFKLLAKKEQGGKRLRNDEVQELVRLVQGAGETEIVQETLFGEEVIRRSNALEKAELSAYIRSALREDKRDFRFASRAKSAAKIAEAGVGSLDVEAAGDIAAQKAQLEEGYNRLSVMAGDVADALNSGAARMAAGEDPNRVKRETYAKVTEVLEAEFARIEEPYRGRGGEDVSGQATLLERPPEYRPRPEAREITREQLTEELKEWEAGKGEWNADVIDIRAGYKADLFEQIRERGWSTIQDVSTPDNRRGVRADLQTLWGLGYLDQVWDAQGYPHYAVAGTELREGLRRDPPQATLRETAPEYRARAEALREEGFDVDRPLYTGMTMRDPARRGKPLDFGGRVWLSNEPEVANSYAQSTMGWFTQAGPQPMGNQVVPVYARTDNIANFGTPEDPNYELLDRLLKELDDYGIDVPEGNRFYELTEHEGMTREEAIPEQLAAHMLEGNLWMAEGVGTRRFETDVLDILEEMGFDGAEFPGSGPGDRYIVIFDAKENTRSTLSLRETPPPYNVYREGPTYYDEAPWAKSVENLEAAAKAYFGTTDEPRRAGFIMTDGTMLDLSERGGPPQRTLDHRSIGYLYPEDYTPPLRDVGSSIGELVDFMGRGNIRMSAATGSVILDIVRKPTEAQYRQIRAAVAAMGPSVDVYVDLNSPMGEVISSRIIHDPDRVAREIQDMIAEQSPGRTVADVYNDIVSEMAVFQQGETTAEGVTTKLIGAKMNKRMLKSMGLKNYNEPTTWVVLKEALQNAIDAIRGMIGGRIRVRIDTRNNIFEIEDNGTGMTPSVAENEFMDPGGTEKPAAGSSGGYGLAKIGLFMDARLIEMETVAQTPTGKVKSWVTGTSEDWMEGRMVKTEERVPDDTPTGTLLRLHLGIDPEEGLSWWGGNRFIKRFLNYDRTGFDIKIIRDGIEQTRADLDEWERTDFPMMPTKTFDVPGARIEVYQSFEKEESKNFPITVLNSGFYQFDQTMYGESVAEVPKRVLVNVIPTSDTLDKNYPFMPNREALSGPAKTEIEEKMRWLGVEKEAEALQSAIDVYRKPYEFGDDDLFGPKFAIYRTAAVSDELIEAIGRSEWAGPLARYWKEIGEAVYRRVHIFDVSMKAPVFAGFSTSIRAQAMNLQADRMQANYATIKKEAEERGLDPEELIPESEVPTQNLLLLNPFGSYMYLEYKSTLRGYGEEEFPERLARNIWGSVVHEVAHQVEKGHGEDYSGYLTDLIGFLADHPQAHHYILELTKLLEPALNDPNFHVLYGRWKTEATDAKSLIEGYTDTRPFDIPASYLAGRAGLGNAPERVQEVPPGYREGAEGVGVEREPGPAGVQPGEAGGARDRDRGAAPVPGSIVPLAPDATVATPREQAKVVADEMRATYGSVDQAKNVLREIVDIGGDMVQSSLPRLSTVEEREADVAKGRAAFRWIPATGQNVAGPSGQVDPERLFRLLKAYRHPAAEIQHVVVTDAEGNIIHHRMTSVGLVNQSFMNSTDFIQSLHMARDAGGKAWQVHNHPSGDPTPSGSTTEFDEEKGARDDRSTTYMLQRHAEKLGLQEHWGGHLIMNDPTAILIPPDNWRGALELRAEQSEWDWTQNQGPPVTGPRQLFDYLRAMPVDLDRLDVFLLGSRNQIVAYDVRPTLTAGDIEVWLPELLQRTGAATAIVATPLEAVEDKVIERFEATDQTLPILDILNPVDRSSAAAKGKLPKGRPSTPTMEPLDRGYQHALRLLEDAPDYRVERPTPEQMAEIRPVEEPMSLIPPDYSNPEVVNWARELVKATPRQARYRIHKSKANAQKWMKALTVEEREDVGAAVEGIANIRTGKPAKQVQEEVNGDPRLKKALEEYRAAQELERVTLNAYLSGVHDDEYIKFLDNYLAHFYAGSKRKRNAFVARWSDQVRAAKKRTLPTLQDAVDAGLVPLTQDMAELHIMWAQVNWRAAINQKFVEELHKLVDDEGQPVIQKVGEGPEHWPKVDHPAVQKIYAKVKYQTKKDGTEVKVVELWHGGARVHPDIYKATRQIFDSPFNNTPVRIWEGLNAWSKNVMLSFSLFHHWALTESAVAALGRGKNPLAGLILVGKNLQSGVSILPGIKITQPHREGLALTKSEPFLRDAMLHGMSAEPIPDIMAGRVMRGLRGLEARTRNIPGLGWLTKKLRQFKGAWDSALWDHYYVGLKAYAYYQIVQEQLAQRPDITGPEIRQMKETIALTINDMFGGQEWESHFAISPHTRQVLHLTMLAPDWTLSNIRVAGTLASSDPMRRQIGRQYWRNMLLFYVALVESVNYALSGGDDEERRWAHENEIGHKMDIDVTGVVRAVQKALGPVPRALVPKGLEEVSERRYYIKPGKQFREVLRYITSPVDIIGAKLSPVVHEIFEQGTGHQAGQIGWPTPWAMEELPWYESIEPRIRNAMEKFVPFAFRSNNFVFTFPMSKGMSWYRAQKAYEDLIRFQVEPSRAEKLLGRPMLLYDAERLRAEIDQAAEMNGLDPEKQYAEARGAVVSGYYSELWEMLERAGDPDLPGHDAAAMRRADEVAAVLMQLRVTWQGVARSGEVRNVPHDVIQRGIDLVPYGPREPAEPPEPEEPGYVYPRR